VYLVKVGPCRSGRRFSSTASPWGRRLSSGRILDMDKSHTVTVRKPGFLPYESSVSPSSSWAKDGNMQTLGVFAS